MVVCDKYTEEVVSSIVFRSLPFFVMVGGWKYKIDDPRWPLSGNTGRESAVDWIINAKLNILITSSVYLSVISSDISNDGRSLFTY